MKDKFKDVKTELSYYSDCMFELEPLTKEGFTKTLSGVVSYLKTKKIQEFEVAIRAIRGEVARAYEKQI